MNLHNYNYNVFSELIALLIPLGHLSVCIVSSCALKTEIIGDTWTTLGGSTEIDTEELHGSRGRVQGAVLWVLFVLLIIGVSIRTCHAATGMIADDHGMLLSGSCSDCWDVGWGPRCGSVGTKLNTTTYIMNHNKLTTYKTQTMHINRNNVAYHLLLVSSV